MAAIWWAGSGLGFNLAVEVRLLCKLIYRDVVYWTLSINTTIVSESNKDIFIRDTDMFKPPL